jgi:hypothetical protein
MGKKAASKSGESLGQKPENEAKNDIPEELEPVWNADVASAFATLEARQRVFLLTYVKTWNGAEAYRQAYNPLANDHIATNSGSRLLAKEGIKIVLEAFLDTQIEDLLLVKRTYVEAAKTASKPIFGKDDLGQPIMVMEQPDHDVRIKAAQALAKLHGFNAADKVEVKTNQALPAAFTTQFNFYLQQMGVAPLALPTEEAEFTEVPKDKPEGFRDFKSFISDKE